MNLSKRVNVIYLSDHGLDSVSPPNFIDLRKFVANNSCDFYGGTPVMQVVPRDKSKVHSHKFTNKEPKLLTIYFQYYRARERNLCKLIQSCH